METKKFNIKFLFFKKSISTYFKITTSSQNDSKLNKYELVKTVKDLIFEESPIKK